MSQKEMDRMDREVMALVNDRDKCREEDIPCGNGPEEQEAHTVEGENMQVKPVDPDAPIPKVDGKCVITEEQYKQLEAAAKKSCRQRTVTCVSVCAAIAGALLVTFVWPGLLPWLMSIGVVTCSVIAGIAVGKQLNQ